jgi:hypothetical protein
MILSENLVPLISGTYQSRSTTATTKSALPTKSAMLLFNIYMRTRRNDNTPLRRWSERLFKKAFRAETKLSNKASN